MSASSTLKCTLTRPSLIGLHTRHQKSPDSCSLQQLNGRKLAVAQVQSFRCRWSKTQNIAPLRSSLSLSSFSESCQRRSLRPECSGRFSGSIPQTQLERCTSNGRRSITAQAKGGSKQDVEKEGEVVKEGEKEETGSPSDSEAEAVAAVTAAILADVSGRVREI